MGSGTLANDVIAGQLSLLGGHGLILSNGEFGERLMDQAWRFNLKFDALKFDWGKPLDLAQVERKLSGHPTAHSEKSSIVNRQSSIDWLWCTHCETSTGVLNDLRSLKALCDEFQVKLCLDCISSIGTMPVDLSGVFLASGSSGKGLRSYPGISMVFHNHAVTPEPERLPRYLDLGYYSQQQGVPFTFSSNLLHALHAAVKHVDWEKRFAEAIAQSTFLRGKLVEFGFALIGSNTVTSPVVITIALPPEMSSLKIGGLIQESGYLVSYNSEYLRKKNWMQICLMGECTHEKVVSLLNAMNRVCSRRTRKTETTKA